MNIWHQRKLSLYTNNKCHRCNIETEDAIHAILCTKEKELIEYTKQTLSQECSSRAHKNPQIIPIQQQWKEDLINRIHDKDENDKLSIRDWVKGIITKELYNTIIKITGSAEIVKETLKTASNKLWEFKNKLWI